jgi:hypothetical protein
MMPGGVMLVPLLNDEQDERDPFVIIPKKIR